MAEPGTGDLRKKAKQAAQIAIVEARQVTQLKHYGTIAKPTATQIRQHGLGQLLAFLHARGKGRESSPYTVLAEQIERHLGDVLPVASGDLPTLTARDSRLYFQATRQTQMFLDELVPFVERFT